MKVAIALESPHASPRSRALALGRRLAGGGGLVGVACLVDATADGPALAARLGLREAFFVTDAALAKAGERGRAQVLARLCARARIDLVLVDATEGGLFPAGLAHWGNMHGFFRARDLDRDPSAPDAVVVTLDLAGARHRLRVELPAVVSVSGESPALPAIEPSAVKSRVFRLPELGLAADTLAPEPIPGATFVPAHRKSEVVAAIDDLLDPPPRSR